MQNNATFFIYHRRSDTYAEPAAPRGLCPHLSSLEGYFYIAKEQRYNSSYQHKISTY